MNLFAVDGIVKHIVYSGKEKPSAILLLQYGPQRNREESRAVEFVNALPVRVPNYLLDKVKDFTTVGARVDIKGRLQGVMKGMLTDGVMTTELVAEQIREARFFGDQDESAAENTADEPKPQMKAVAEA